MIYTIYGEVVPKKNSKQIFFNKKTGRRFITSSERFKQWNETAMLELRRQILPDTVRYSEDNPCKITLVITHGDKRKRDPDNAENSIFDLLKEVGIIQDDNYMVIPIHTTKHSYCKNNAKVDILIEGVNPDDVQSM